MMPLVIRPDASLSEILRARAQTSPKSRLVLDVIGGGIIAVALAWARPPGWILWLSAALCLFAYGLWAFAERHLTPEVSTRAMHRWLALQGAAAVLGIAALLLFMFALLGVGLGTWIS